jgi:NAD+ diphosphatase
LEIFYRELKLDRASESRKNEDWLHHQWTRQECRVYVLHQDKNLMHWPDREATPEIIQLSKSQFKNLDPINTNAIFLGMDGSSPLFALDLTGQDYEELVSLPDASEFIDLRECGWLLDAQHAGLMAYARGLAFWNRSYQFCGNCGQATLFDQGGHVRRCSNSSCEKLHFPRTDPAVIMLVEDRSDPDNPRCLLARNSRFPSRMMSTLAGFVDPLESLEETVTREVFEECGIIVEQVEYQESQPWPFPASIMLGFRARAVTREIKVDGDEIEEAYWFDLDQLKEFGEWGDGGDSFCLPRKDSIARYLVESWIRDVTPPGSAA